jgi:hypothetical protein
MNRTVLGLSIAVVALAMSTAYLAYRVHQERRLLGRDFTSPSSEVRVSTGQAGETGPSRKPGAIDRGGAASPDTANGNASSTEKSGGRPSFEDLLRVQNELTVRLYNDPQGRRELIEERIPTLRDKYLLLQRRLKVDDLTWLRFLEVVAERELGYSAARADCKATNTCNRVQVTPELVNEDRRPVAEVLGEARAKEVSLFEESDIERRGVATLQKDIPQSQRLSEERSEELVMALNKLREEAVMQMSRAETPVGIYFGRGGGALVYDRNLPTTEARVEAATNYSKRLREQARKHLSGKLLDAYNRQLDEMLEQMSTSKEQ